MLKPGRTGLLAAVIALALLAEGVFAAAEPLTVRIMDLEERPGEMEITVSALDIKSRPLAGLTASNFKISLGDAQLPVRELIDPEAARQPASVLLVVDVSGSMAGDPITQARNAMRDFVQTLEPADYVGIVSFSNSVTHLQSFTTDRTLLSNAIGSLQASGETALYDAMLTASEQMAQAPTSRQLVVLLSDGRATVGLPNRNPSIQSAVVADAGVVAVGLGADLDTQYLNELAKATNGRYLAAPTPASLRQAYQDLAYAIRSQYTLLIDVPPVIDRTVPGILRVHATYWSDTSFTERELAPLPGATKPPFNMQLGGIKPGERVSEGIALSPAAPEGVRLTRVEYLVDGAVVHTAEGEDLSFAFDPSVYAEGNHVITVQAIDESGKPGRVDVPFIVAPAAQPSGGFSLPVIPIVIALAVGVVGWMLFKLFKKQRDVEPVLVSARPSSWEARIPKRDNRLREVPDNPGEAEPDAPRRPAVARQVVNTPRGRVIVMNEEAIRSGHLDAIQEYEIFNTPLTFGTGADADVQVDDPTGMIASEEARIWVQRGRLVYHKLTTLSAMATEGVTSGWQFLEDGEELRIGTYRVVFQVYTQETQITPKAAQRRPTGLPQEHGMHIRHAWEGAGDYPSLPEITDSSLEAGPGADPSSREEEAPNDRSPFHDESGYRSA